VAQPPSNGEALAAYTASLFAAEDALLRELREQIEQRGLPPIQVPAGVGKVLQLLLRAIGARRVLEIGTLGGTSAIWMARALPADGRLLTLELEPAHAALAGEYLERAGLAARVEVRLGPALETLARLATAAEPLFDAAFIDADKESYPAYLAWTRRLVRVGGLILADNAYRAGRVLRQPAPAADVAAIQRFNRLLARDPGLTATILPVGDGLAVGLVTDAPDTAAGDGT
jgi:predicted O-methyltransferase YrrM